MAPTWSIRQAQSPWNRRRGGWGSRGFSFDLKKIQSKSGQLVSCNSLTIFGALQFGEKSLNSPDHCAQETRRKTVSIVIGCDESVVDAFDPENLLPVQILDQCARTKSDRFFCSFVALRLVRFHLDASKGGWFNKNCFTCKRGQYQSGTWQVRLMFVETSEENLPWRSAMRGHIFELQHSSRVPCP